MCRFIQNFGFEWEDGQIRIGIDAPKDVPVHRAEVYDRILAETD